MKKKKNSTWNLEFRKLVVTEITLQNKMNPNKEEEKLRKEWIRRYLSKTMVCGKDQQTSSYVVKCHTTHSKGCVFRACKHFCCSEHLSDKYPCLIPLYS